MKIVTGATGTNHVTANDDGGLYASIFGGGCYVLSAGERFPCTVIGDTQVQIGQGEGLMYGRHFRTPRGSIDQLPITSGVAGYNRNDIIAAHYKNTGGIESVELVVLTGTSTTGAAEDPSYAEEDISAGAIESYMPLYRVRLSGTSISGVDTLYTLRDVAGEDAAKKYHAKATIGTTWEGDGPYTQTVSVPGLLETDTPIIDLLASTDLATAETELEAWAAIYRIDTAADSIKVYASDATTQAITIQLQGVR